MNITNSNVSESIKNNLRVNRMTLEVCCDAFNRRYFKEIETGHLKPLNKDFLSRVARGDFKVLSSRILKLCEFLKIDNPQQQDTGTLSYQINEFQKMVEEDASLRQKFPQILAFLDVLQTNSKGVTL